MKRPGIFLTAQWLHLAMVNWPVDAALVEPHVPRGTRIDFFRGQTFVSLVGFRFVDTRLGGVAIPGHRDFEELNLRIYIVRDMPDGPRRGVSFIKEIVPRRAVATVARWVYNENYDCLPMRHAVSMNGAPDELERIEYGWRLAGNWHGLRVEVASPRRPAELGSEPHFITDHYWGYSRQRDGGTLEYEVEHPPWQIWPATDHHLDCDIARLYGPDWAEELSRPPSSAFVCDGSAVNVRRGVRVG